MKIAYLVNQYPAVSHSFIRREILALEDKGVRVDRYSIRPSQQELVDEGDIAEAGKTVAILSSGLLKLAYCVAKAIVLRPLAFARTAAFALISAGASPSRLFRHTAYLAEACFLLHRFSRFEVDHVHVHFGTNPATVARLLRRLGGPSFSVTMHGPDEFNAPEFYDLRGKTNEASATFAISDYGRSQLMMWSALKDWPKLHVVRCGVDTALLAHPSVPFGTAPRFCTVARLSEAKGIPVLIEAASILKSQGIQFELHIVGEGPLRPQIEALLNTYQLTEQVRLLGALSSENVRRELLASRAMVLPSFAEGLPVVIMEALALERPVITTRITGIPELVDQDCGWVVPAGRPDLIVAAMKAALDASPEQLQAMGRVGRDRVRDQHDIDKIAPQLIEIFAKCTREMST